MDMYGTYDPSLASGSGTNTPVRETAPPVPSQSTENNDALAGPSPSAASSSANATTNQAASSSKAAKQTLEQEIEQMGTVVSSMGKNLGGYWSAFRKQSENALKQSQQLASNAAKDLTPYLDKAKAELDKLNEQAKASAAAGQAAAISDLGVNIDNPSVVLNAPREDKGKGVDRTGGDPVSPSGSTTTLRPEHADDGNHPAMTATAFFSKLQGQLANNPNFQNFQHSFQNVQHDLKNKMVDFNKIDMHEAKETYEKAMNSSEKYWKVASKELSDLFGEAVRIVPPEGYKPEDQGQRFGAAGKAADKRRKEAAVAAAGRKEMLLHRIRSDPAVLLVDPSEAPVAISTGAGDNTTEEKKEVHVDTREAFTKFLASIDTDGGLKSDTWADKIRLELEDEDSGLALRQTQETTVPSKLTYETFWSRYFFRKQQIEEDEARRREILEGAAQQDEDDFSWDMEDESASSAAAEEEGAQSAAPAANVVTEETISTPKVGKTGKPDQAAASPDTSDDVNENWGSPQEGNSASSSPPKPSTMTASRTTTVKSSSPRNSSEEGTTSSYDVVSTGDATSPRTEKAPAVKKEQQDGDSDSDWE